MKKLLLSAFLFPSYFLFAQEVHPVSGEPLKYCGTAGALKDLYKNNPGLEAEIEAMDLESMKQEKVNPATNAVLPIYQIPVVVHILHNYGNENISDAQVYDAINILRRDFRKQNADTATVQTPFKNLIADCEVEFYLAQLDPNGNCTNGIDRIVTTLTSSADDNAKLNQWPRNKYLNIWTCANIASGAAGYSYYPSATVSNPGIDGVMILHNYFGSIGTSSPNTSRALTHEVGHWANLQHCWGSTNQPGVACGDDAVTDTPVTKGWTSCNLSSNDVCTPGTDENVENYMEYAYCQKMYTPGQKTRVRNALFSSTASRNNLWSASNLTATGLTTSSNLCNVDFTANKQVVCVGTPITFTDMTGGMPTGWKWDVNNDGTDDYFTQTITHTYSTPGTYAVKLTANNSASTQSKTKTNYVVVLNSGASLQPNYAEGFENAGFPYADWGLVCSSTCTGNTWQRVTGVSATGTACLKLDNYSATTGDIDEAISPSINLYAATGITFTFKVANAQRASGDAEKLRVLVSTYCGSSWTQRYSKSGSTLATSGIVSGAYTPSSAADWRTETVTIQTYAQPDFRFKFEFTGDGSGNNIYIDDINISITNLGISEEAANDFGLSISPNPFNENSVVSFTTGDKYSVGMKVMDVLGKEVISTSPVEMTAGNH